MDIRAENDKIGVKGELFIFACTGVMMTIIPAVAWSTLSLLPRSWSAWAALWIWCQNIDVTMPQSKLEVKTDSDGEERLIGVDAVLELEMKIYEEEEMSLLLDVYTPVKECVPIRENRKLESLLVKNNSKCRVATALKWNRTREKSSKSATATGM